MKFWRNLTEPEKSVSLEEINSSITLSEESLAEELNPIVEKMAKRFVTDLKAASDPLKVGVSYLKDYERVISTSIRKAIKEGYAIASRDIKVAVKDLPNVARYADKVANLYAQKAAMDLKFSILLSYFQLKSKEEISGE